MEPLTNDLCPDCPIVIGYPKYSIHPKSVRQEPEYRMRQRVSKRAGDGRTGDGVTLSLNKLVSGGQTGVDRAALDAAIELGIQCGGWCPKGRRAEDGVIPAGYPLQETASKDYRKRTRMNVIDSDATLILSGKGLSGGTALTAGIARKNDKPLLVIDLEHPPPAQEVTRWIEDNRIGTLNVAGPRESECAGIHRKGKAFLLQVLGV